MRNEKRHKVTSWQELADGCLSVNCYSKNLVASGVQHWSKVASEKEKPKEPLRAVKTTDS